MRGGTLVVASLLVLGAVGLTVSAQRASVQGHVLDADGAPVADAVVLLHETGEADVTDEDGAFEVPGRPPAQVALVETPQGVTLTWFRAEAGQRTALRHAPMVDELSATTTEERTVSLRGPAGPADHTGPHATLMLAFPPNVHDAEVTLVWPNATLPQASSTLDAWFHHVPSGHRVGPFSGSSPLSISLDGNLLTKLAGTWRLELEARVPDAVPRDVTATVEVREGHAAMRHVLGQPAHVPGAAEATGRGLFRSPSLNVLAASFDNETVHGYEVHIALEELDLANATQDGHVSVWMIEWEQEGSTRFVALERRNPSDRTAPPSGPPSGPSTGSDATRAIAGTCTENDPDEVCFGWARVGARVHEGRPGTISFLVPKALTGSPDAGVVLSDPVARTAITPTGFPMPRSVFTSSSVYVDQTPPGRPYTMGADAYHVDSEVFQAVRNAHGEGLVQNAATAAPGTPWLVGGSIAAVLAAGLVLGVVALKRRHHERYHRMSILGRGTSGTTWLAQHRRLGKLVAIKDVADHLANDRTERARLVREARIAGSLHHPNVVQVFDLDEGTTGTSIIMEYVEAGSLADRLAEEPRLDRDAALAITRDVLAGLEAIHDAGIVHRDIKPSNIMLDVGPRAKIADFGIASSHMEGTLQGPRVPLGTPLYMAPEQGRGEPATPASDLYAVTAVLYRMLAGRPPVEVPAAGPWEFVILRQRLRPELPLPDEPAWLNEFLARGLADDPTDRFASAAHMRRLLEAQASELAEGELAWQAAQQADGLEGTLDGWSKL